MRPETNAIVLNEEELNDMSELERGPRFLQVKCDCTNRKYGDFTGRLRISTSGHVVIACESKYPNCPEATLTPDNFLKHCGNEGTRYWKPNIWVIVNDEKVVSRSRSVYSSTTKMHQIYISISVVLTQKAPNVNENFIAMYS